MMKTRRRLLFLGTVAFILFVSFKILEPEIFKNSDAILPPSVVEPKEFPDPPAEQVGYDDNVFHTERSIQLQPDGIGRDGVVIPLIDSSQDTIDKLVKTMSERFIPQYSYHINRSPWRIAEDWVTQRYIHPENAVELGSILHAMATSKITKADVGHKGTQLKLTLTLDGVQKVVFKPAWYERDYIVTGLPYAGRDRHNAEIAAFHLGRILELRRTPLTIGRRVDLVKDILPVATQKLQDTFFEKDGEKCFYGKCLYCRGPDDGVCATNGVLEGTLVLWIPPSFKMHLHKHPWARTYRQGVEPKWLQRDDYCTLVKNNDVFKTGPRLLDIVDTAIFDFLIGNADRHHYETFDGFDDSILIMLDNGKSFGNPHHDEMTILAPLYQCCLVRANLWQRLLALQDQILSRVLNSVLSADPIAPVLTQQHLDALDRRLKIALEQIQACIAKVGLETIVVDKMS